MCHQKTSDTAAAAAAAVSLIVCSAEQVTNLNQLELLGAEQNTSINTTRKKSYSMSTWTGLGGEWIDAVTMRE